MSYYLEISVILTVLIARSYSEKVIQNLIEYSYTNFELNIRTEGYPDKSLNRIKLFNDIRVRILNIRVYYRNYSSPYKKISIANEHIPILDSYDIADTRKLTYNFH